MSSRKFEAKVLLNLPALCIVPTDFHRILPLEGLPRMVLTECWFDPLRVQPLILPGSAECGVHLVMHSRHRYTPAPKHSVKLHSYSLRPCLEPSAVRPPGPHKGVRHASKAYVSG